jgi:exopolysaccharide biosynthesis polyprenyl glycosylphosphotransferase
VDRRGKLLRENLRILRKLVFAADLCLVALGFQLSVIIDNARIGFFKGLISSDELLLPAVIIWGLVLWCTPECYVFRLKKIIEIFRSSFKVSLVSSGFILAFIFFTAYLEWRKFQVILFIALATAFLIIFRLAILKLLSYYRRRGYNYQTVLIIGTGSAGRDFADRILNNLHFGLKILGFLACQPRPGLWRYRDIPCIGGLSELPEILKRSAIDYVVFAVDKNHLGAIEDSVKICEEMGVRVSVLADFFHLKLAKGRVESFFGAPMVCYDPVPPLSIPIFVKAILDRVLAFWGLIMLSPIMLLTAIAVKAISGGPIIFRQPRCGLNGRIFTLYKFRTMVRHADKLKRDLMKFNEIDGAAFKMKNDPRVTPFGRFLRKTSLDELPQLFNILRGEMSFVGPRPPLAEEVARYDLWQRRKLSVKPGLTCLWQVSGRSDVSFKEWMKLDLEYIDNWSLKKDAEILVRTVPAVLKGTGAR